MYWLGLRLDRFGLIAWMALPVSFLVLESGDQAEALERNDAYTTMTRASVKTWPVRQAALLISEDERIEEMGSLTRSHRRVATGWHRLRYLRRSEFSPLRLEELIETVPKRFQATVAHRAIVGGVLPQKTALEVINALDQLRPGAARALRDLMGADQRARHDLKGNALQAAGHEADAVRLAVDIADIPRRALRDLRPDGQMSFLQQLEEVRAGEDPTVAYDSMRFLDFDRIDNPSGIVQFAKGAERLTVINVNRQPLEYTTGADLIYINETIGSFVLVQYKTMRREGSAPARLVYRPDAQLEAELGRMRGIKGSRGDGSPGSFRLHRGFSFVKLCKPVASLEQTRDLVSGMYLPLDYYDALVASEDVRGPKGGVVLGYDTVRRHVGNDLFVLLVRGGWVGSRGPTTKRLTQLTLDGLGAGRSVTVAAASLSSNE